MAGIKIPVDKKELDDLIATLEALDKKMQGIHANQSASAAKLASSVTKLNATTQAQRDQLEQSAEEAEKLTKARKKLNSSIGENAVELEKLKNAQRKANQISKLEAALAEAKTESYEALEAQYKLNLIALKQFTKEELKNNEEAKKLSETNRQLREDMEAFKDSTGRATLQVKQASEGMSGFQKGINRAGQAVKAFIKNPLVLTLTLAASALLALGNAFKSSKKGAELFQKAGAVISGLFSGLVGLATKIADSISFAFSNPVEALKNFGQLIINQIWNRVTGAIKLFGALGRIIKNVITFNFKGVKEAAADAGDAITQVATGLTKVQRNRFAGGLKSFIKLIKSETEANYELAKAKLSVRRANRELTKSIEELTTKEAIYNSIADDATKSFKEREKAAKAASQALISRSKKEVALAKTALSLINEEIRIKKSFGQDVEDLLDQQLDAYRKVIAAEREQTLAIRDNQKIQGELKQDRLEKDLDILLDAFDNQKSINERQLNDERKTAEERQAIFKETVRLADDSFKKQIETVQKFTGVSINANELLAESDAVVLNEKIRSLGLSEIIEGRLLEIIRDRRTANQDLLEAEIEIAKKSRENQLKELKDKQDISKSDFELTKRTNEEQFAFALQQKQEELRLIEELNGQFSNELPPIDTSKLEASIRSLNAKLKEGREKDQAILSSNALELFNQQQEFKKSEFDLLEKTEKEKTEFQLNAEKDRLNKILDLNKEFNGKLSTIQIDAIKNQVAKIDSEISSLSDGGEGFTDIYDLFGFNIDDPTKEGIATSINYVKGQLTDLAATRTAIAQQNVQQANTDIAEAQRALQIEIQNRDAGLNHQVATRQKELEEAKKAQASALKEQEKAQKAQQRIDTLEQSVSLVTASAKIWKTLGFPWAIPAIGLMFGSFVAARLKANQLAKKQFAKGGLEIIGGGTHASGDDTYLGFQSEGKPAYAERGEAHIILPTKQTRKYKSELPFLVESLRKGTFEQNYQKINANHSADSIVVLGGGNSTDTSKMENSLNRLVQQNETKYHNDGNGNAVEVYKNLTRVYVKA